MDVEMSEQEPIEPININDNIAPKNNSTGSPKSVVIEENEQQLQIKMETTVEDSKVATSTTTTTTVVDAATAAAAGAEIVTTETAIPGTEQTTIMNDEEEKNRLEEEARKFLSLQAQEIVIPSYAAWFDMAKIHNIEKKSLPEFFNKKNKSKNPTVYKEYRDFIINAYRLNPSEYLTVTACRRNLAGDVCAIIRVHAFLEQWGLINYQVDQDTRPSSVAPPFTGHFVITADAPRGLQPYLPKGSVAVDCTQSRYHSLKNGKLDLCLNCYSSGHYPTSMHSGDFLKMDEAQFKHAQDEEWTEQETLALLEGIELYEDDWHKIAEHVGTRTRDQCILHFLEFPIEDPLNGAKMSKLGPLQYQRMSFSQADNPVLSVVAYLASIVSPNVAAAAAKSAIKELPSPLPSSSSAVAAKNNNNSETNPKESNESNDVNHDTQTIEEGRIGDIVDGEIKVKNEDAMDTEDREIQRLVNKVIKNQLKKLELKLQQFDELENVIENERKEIEKQRQLLYLERLTLKKNSLIIQKQLKGGDGPLVTIRQPIIHLSNGTSESAIINSPLAHALFDLDSDNIKFTTFCTNL
ncbi:508_t:CDS:2 [Entrophospora sp. SA101]|nr:508_t:CDS:2 [Entrophospora sp. SA101]CAJ0845960.1 14747_t:CDS:2 [Entrophospora sp. SA101]